MKRLDRFMARVSAALALLAGGLIAVILLVMVIDVACRNLAGSSLAGAYEVVTIMLVGVVFLGLAHAERSDSNIKLTLFTSRLPAAVAQKARLVGGSVSLLLCLVATWATISAAQGSIARGEYQQGILSIPIWPAKVIIALGFTVLAIELVLSLRRTWISPASRAGAAEQEAAGLVGATEPAPMPGSDYLGGAQQ